MEFESVIEETRTFSWLDRRSLAAIAWLNTFALMWAIMLGIIERNYVSGLGFVFFLFVALCATYSKEKTNE